MKKRERKSCDFTCRPPEIIKLGELPLFMFSSSGTFGVTVTGRMTNKQGLKEGLNPKAAELVTKCMNPMGHKHRPHLTLFLHLKEQRKHSASMKHVLLWYLSSSSCRSDSGKDGRFPALYSLHWHHGKALPFDAPSAKTALSPHLHQGLMPATHSGSHVEMHNPLCIWIMFRANLRINFSNRKGWNFTL